MLANVLGGLAFSFFKRGRIWKLAQHLLRHLGGGWDLVWLPWRSGGLPILLSPFFLPWLFSLMTRLWRGMFEPRPSVNRWPGQSRSPAITHPAALDSEPRRYTARPLRPTLRLRTLPLAGRRQPAR
jgi:hypothetical protein